MADGLLVLLGNENDENGNLNAISEKRIKSAVELLRGELDGYLVLPTGSFGEYFNQSTRPHGQIVKQRLEEKGIRSDRILPHTQTAGTKEDAYATLRRLKDRDDLEKVCVLTSEFHMKRVKFVFSKVLQGYRLTFVSAPNPSEAEMGRAELEQRRKHEEKRLQEYREKWVDVSNFDLERDPSVAHQTLASELQHYDRYSYLALLGAFLSASFAFSHRGEGVPLVSSLLVNATAMGLVIALGYLYFRLAATANSARRVMIEVEKLYGHPGISWTNPVSVFGGDEGPSVTTIVFALLTILVLGLAVEALLPLVLSPH